MINGITDGEGVLGRGLRQSELRKATPYNTYVIEGLPPTPIANPGEASLMAAVQPDETPYLFFVADGTGGHAFAETLDEHNRNVARWREFAAERESERMALPPCRAASRLVHEKPNETFACRSCAWRNILTM